MKKITQIAYIIFLFFISCTKDENSSPVTKDFVTAVDISQYPEIASSNISFKDFNGNQKDLLDLLKENGVNTIRLRLWVNPVDEHCGFEEVKQFSQVLKLKGFKTWLTVHYSDTWADPANQQMPSQWEGLSYTSLKDSVYNYTKKVVNQIIQTTFKLEMKSTQVFCTLLEKSTIKIIS